MKPQILHVANRNSNQTGPALNKFGKKMEWDFKPVKQGSKRKLFETDLIKNLFGMPKKEIVIFSDFQQKCASGKHFFRATVIRKQEGSLIWPYFK